MVGVPRRGGRERKDGAAPPPVKASRVRAGAQVRHASPHAALRGLDSRGPWPRNVDAARRQGPPWLAGC